MQVTLTELELPARLRPQTPLSDDELMRFCAVNDGLRIERDSNGELILLTPAGFETGPRNSRIIAQLTGWADQDGRGIAFDSNTGFTLPDDSMRSPDAAWLSFERLETLPPDKRRGFAPVVPEFIIELVSENDTRSEVEAKMQMWMGNGALLAWLIDLYAREALIYREDQAPETLFSPGEVSGTGPASSFRLSLEKIWV